jgi:hypothetical protein
MADAIPVHSEPKKPKAGKVKVGAGEQVETHTENGTVLPPPYITQERENLGSPEDFAKGDEVGEVRETQMEVRGTLGPEAFVHRYTRVDH